MAKRQRRTFQEKKEIVEEAIKDINTYGGIVRTSTVAAVSRLSPAQVRDVFRRCSGRG